MVIEQEKYIISDHDKEELERLLRSPKTAQALTLRAKIILLTVAGHSTKDVAHTVGTTIRSVYRWRKRFRDTGVAGLNDLPRPGQPKKRSEDMVKEVLRLTVHCIPDEATHWSVRLMAKAAGITTWQVRQIWKAADMKPHRL